MISLFGVMMVAAFVGLLIYVLTAFALNLVHGIAVKHRNRENALERRIETILRKYPDDPEAVALRDILSRIRKERTVRNKVRELREVERYVDKHIKKKP